MQDFPNLGPFRFRPAGLSAVKVQTGDNGRVNMLGDHQIVAHQHRVELANIDTQFKSRRADKAIHGIGGPLEQILQPFAFLVGNHSRVFFGTEHGVCPVQQLQVVVVEVFRDPSHNPVATPSGASVVRYVLRRGAPTAQPRATPGSEGTCGVRRAAPCPELARVHPPR